jgi:hypothetical protein
LAPVAAAGFAMIGALLVVASGMGTLGGVITALLRGDLALGALLSAGAFLAIAPFLGRWAASFIGLLPLILSFLVAALTTGALQARRVPRPLAAVAGLVTGLGMSFLYGFPIRYGIWLSFEVATAWIALAIFLVLVVISMRKRRRALRS